MIETHWHWHSYYPTDLKWQNQRHQEIQKGVQPEAILFSEHLSCITFGKRGGERQKTSHTPVFQINRGGLATWHGPGQLILYPLINLRKRAIGTKDFVICLENSVIRTLRLYGISARRRERCPGIWIEGQKIASIGLEIKKGISKHGCAININNSLLGFREIVPCGFPNIKMVSVAQLLGKELSLYQFGQQWRENFLVEIS